MTAIPGQLVVMTGPSAHPGIIALRMPLVPERRDYSRGLATRHLPSSGILFHKGRIATMVGGGCIVSAVFLKV